MLNKLFQKLQGRSNGYFLDHPVALTAIDFEIRMYMHVLHENFPHSILHGRLAKVLNLSFTQTYSNRVIDLTLGIDVIIPTTLQRRDIRSPSPPIHKEPSLN